MERVGPKPVGVDQGSPAAEEWIARVQSQMLEDQGLPSTDEQRQLLVGATFLPVRLYGAVLYGEIEFLQGREARRSLLSDDEVADVLVSHQVLIDRLRAFRDRLLHPTQDSEVAERTLLQDGLHNQIPALQQDVDHLIERVRQRVRVKIDSILGQLPQEQSQICQWLHLRECLDHPVFQQHEDTLERIAVESNQLAIQLQEHADLDSLASPSEQQRDKAQMIACWLTSTSPLNTVRDVPEFDSIQPPMNVRLMKRLLRPKPAVAPQLNGREAAYIKGNWRGYVQQMHTVSVLLNETSLWAKRVLPPSVDREHSSSTVVAAAHETAPTEFVRLAALGRVMAALLVPLLVSYVKVRRDNPTVRIAALDSLVEDSNALEQCQRFRNSIFHVQQATDDAERLDSALFDASPDDNPVEALYDGCAEFLSWFAPAIPRS